MHDNYAGYSAYNTGSVMACLMFVAGESINIHILLGNDTYAGLLYSLPCEAQNKVYTLYRITSI